MSYCRWSDENFACDIYAYQSEAGYEIHVASNKITGALPPLPDLQLPYQQWYPLRCEWEEAFDNAERQPIGLPHDGESFTEPDLESFETRLRSLSAMGYRLPDWVFEMIAEEMES